MGLDFDMRQNFMELDSFLQYKCICVRVCRENAQVEKASLWWEATIFDLYVCACVQRFLSNHVKVYVSILVMIYAMQTKVNRSERALGTKNTEEVE